MRQRRFSNTNARPLNATVRSRMKEFSFSPWLAARAKRLRTYRALGNTFRLLLVTFVTLAVLDVYLRSFLPTPIHQAISWLIFITLAALLLLFLTWILVGWRFTYGMMQCPSCDMPYGRGLNPITLLWIPRNCPSCGFDIYTVRHATSNNRSRVP